MKGAKELNKKSKNVFKGDNSSVSTDNKAEEFGTEGCCLELIGERVSEKKEERDELRDPLTSHSHSKIKLQLYPMDEVTRIGLEKDGIHPYLELTLRSTKKISSVLKHIDQKWRSSKIALGELILVPYNLHCDISRSRTWTMKDSETRTGDVYECIGRPEKFRLRYGWVQPPELDTYEDHGSDVKIPDKDEVRIEERQGCLELVNDVKDHVKDEAQIGESKGSLNLINDDRQRMINQPGQSASQWNEDISNISVGAFLSEAKNTDKPRSSENESDLQHAQNSQSMVASWADSLIDISIGGFLSEVSLQGAFNNGNNAKSIMGNGDSLSTQIFSDSLDAFLSARNRFPQGFRPPSNDSQTFILDGEDTCHAFPVQKFSSSGKRVSFTSGSTSSQDSGSKPFKFSKFDQINSRGGVSEDRNCQDPQTDHFLSPRTYNDENSLGLANIKWGDSLGPFDLGLPASGKLDQRENSNSRFLNK